jgi:hypothetical protein
MYKFLLGLAVATVAFFGLVLVSGFRLRGYPLPTTYSGDTYWYPLPVRCEARIRERAVEMIGSENVVFHPFTEAVKSLWDYNTVMEVRIGRVSNDSSLKWAQMLFDECPEAETSVGGDLPDKVKTLEFISRQPGVRELKVRVSDDSWHIYLLKDRTLSNGD